MGPLNYKWNEFECEVMGAYNKPANLQLAHLERAKSQDFQTTFGIFEPNAVF